MEAVLELLNLLVSKGIKLAVEGDKLSCYAQKNLLTMDIRSAIVQHEAQLIDRIRKYNRVQVTPAAADGKSNITVSRESERLKCIAAKSLDLEAEAVLDPGIQPSTAIDDGTDLATSKAILLTGASGFLGAYLLRDLILTTEASVYCLIRCRSENDGAERIKNNLVKYGLWRDDFASRIIPLPGDLARGLLGLREETFNNLSYVIDTIYHNGALVNFSYPYANLKDANVRGTEEVIRLACRARRKPLHFVSTVGIYPPKADRTIRVLESDPPSDWHGLTDGYGQSKWVAEKIVTIAADRGLPVRIYRPGFVTGDSTTGISNTEDFVCRMIKGCIQLGSVPDSNAMIEMAPVDYVSKAIIHLSRRRQSSSNIFHIINPHSIPAIELGRIYESLGYRMKLVSYPDWREALLGGARTSSSNALYPLLPMFTEDPFLERMPAFDCRRTLEGLRGSQIVCPEINIDLMATYLAYFKKSGFMDA